MKNMGHSPYQRVLPDSCFINCIETSSDSRIVAPKHELSLVIYPMMYMVTSLYSKYHPKMVDVPLLSTGVYMFFQVQDVAHRQCSIPPLEWIGMQNQNIARDPLKDYYPGSPNHT